MVHSNLGKNSDVIQKITKAKRAGSMAQVVECLPRACYVLRSGPSTAKEGRREGTYTREPTSWFPLYDVLE
jgi:hypothetical protein